MEIKDRPTWLNVTTILRKDPTPSQRFEEDSYVTDNLVTISYVNDILETREPFHASIIVGKSLTAWCGGLYYYNDNVSCHELDPQSENGATCGRGISAGLEWELIR